MKRLAVIMFLCLLTLFSFTTIFATEPIIPGEITIEFDNCDSNADFDNIYIEFLVDPDYVVGFDYTFVYNEGVINQGYLDAHPDFESFDFLEYNGYVSPNAYIDNYGIDNGPHNCRLFTDTMLDMGDDFYMVVVDETGSLLFREQFSIGEVGRSADYDHYYTIVYDLENHTYDIETDRVFSLMESLLFLLVGVIIVIVVTIFSSVYVAKKQLLKEDITNQSYYLLIVFLVSLISILMLVLYQVLGIYYFLIPFYLIVMHVAGVGGWVLISNKFGHVISKRALYKPFIVSISICLLIWIGFIMYVEFIL